MKKLLLLLFLSTLTLSALYAQSTGTEYVADSIWQKKLFESPDKILPVLIEAALQHAPEVEIELAEKEIVNQDAIIARKALLSGVSLVSAYNYGTAGNLSVTESTINNPVNSFTTAKSSRYTVGVNLSLPLDKVFTRGNQLKKKQIELHQTELNQKIKENDIRKEVMGLYQELVLTNRILLLSNESLNSMQIHKKMAEKEFVEGEIPVSEIVRVSEMYTKAAVSNEEVKSKLKSMYLLLEQRVGVKLSELLIGK
ncbi:TolC family protein [Cytophagaceae bacterium DM2B3-1]|uniref:TolC family protein n=1 Tax=Xanthocytophaga flava TaxID=3048013 RepID=A0ABT7CJN3_9BACT|nr:TolC family protein [Xanthocytophaga flavus]MDJ1467839.1 TolC family protein [Xanthocytophaga flavus]MDJ1493917.1 TolC family protein [Xanthocytophaga flavus]